MTGTYADVLRLLTLHPRSVSIFAKRHVDRECRSACGTLLRKAEQGTLTYKTELARVREQNIDITNFESELDEFRSGFARNYNLASKKFKTAIDEIDKTIDHLQKTKEALLGSENNLRLANNKATT